MSEEDDQEITIIPNFDSPSLFPCKKFRNGFGVEASKTRNPNIVAKIFVFNKEAITRLKSKVTGRRAATRVGVVCALIAKVLITLDLEKNGLPRDCLITQAVNIRERTIPPLPKHSCGNLAAFAVAHCKGSDNVVGFEDLVEVLGESVGKTVENSAEILSGGEGGHGVFIDTVMKVFDATAGGKMNILLFSDWTKFGFYDAADFGWRKPVWASIDVMPAENLAVLMECKDGDGVEAWVHLNREDMAYFDQDEEIRSFVA